MDFFDTHISEEAIKMVTKTLKSSYISAGKIASEFEDSIEKKLQIENAVSVNSCTSALHLGLTLMNLKKGDEVILPAQTFIASGLSILMAGATPIFADINYKTGNINPNSIEEKLTRKTKAIMVVHYGGLPCDMDEICKIALKHKLFVIEDAAHAFGSTYRKKPIGSISDFTAFSFQAIKQLTTGDGGIIICKSKKNYQRAKKLRWFGIDREKSKASYLGERVFDVNEIGFKYHMNDISASLGIANLKSFSKRLKRVKQIASSYREEFSKISDIDLLDNPKDRENSYWLYPLHVKGRKAFIKKMLSESIPASVVHQGIDRFSVFGGKQNALVNQRRFDKTQISLPIHPALVDEDVKRIIQAVKRGW